ncbi:MAG TPA: radical SAM protein [Polyangia bacterium]|nr:radical SAM protein [Polyangia bacterium]
MNLRNLDREELRAAVAPFGVSAEVAARLFARVHRDGAAGLAHGDVRGMTKASAEALAAACEWPDLEIIERRRAEDGFVKYLFRLPDGHAVEAVRIPLPDPEDARALKERRREGTASGLEALPTAKFTLCVSSQVGCALACDFCATGRLGGIRSLKTWEILAQHRLVAADAEHPVRGVVFMGMGEPLLNYENVIRAARILSDPAGPAIGAKAISISTAGVVPAIRRFTAEGHRYRLLVSLGAPTSAERRALMPIEDRWPLPELMEAVRAHAAATGQRIPLAYVAIGGVNTSPRHARELAALVDGLRVKINLIDVSDETGKYRAPTAEELGAFRDALDELGAPVVRRYSGGKDIAAACGTLAASQNGGAVVGEAADPVVPLARVTGKRLARA